MKSRQVAAKLQYDKTKHIMDTIAVKQSYSKVQCGKAQYDYSKVTITITTTSTITNSFRQASGALARIYVSRPHY